MQKTLSMQTTAEYPDIGAVRFVRSTRAKYLRITVSADVPVRVTVPRRTGFEEARRFLDSKRKWVQQQLAKLRQRQTAVQDEIVLSDEALYAAQEKLVRRLEELADRHGYRYGRVTIRCQKTKWGSCSGQNNINLNVNLVFLPEHLRDYVLLHELVHTKHKNHGPRFWNELERRCEGRAKQYRHELRQYVIRPL